MENAQNAPVSYAGFTEEQERMYAQHRFESSLAMAERLLLDAARYAADAEEMARAYGKHGFNLSARIKADAADAAGLAKEVTL